MKNRPFTLRCVCQVERTEKNCLSSEPASVRLTHEMRKEKKWLVDARSVSKLMISVFFFLWRRRFFQHNCISPPIRTQRRRWATSDQKPRATNFSAVYMKFFNFLVFLLSFTVRYEFGFCSTSLCLHDSGALNAQFWALCIQYSPTHNSFFFCRFFSLARVCLFDSYHMNERERDS